MNHDHLTYSVPTVWFLSLVLKCKLKLGIHFKWSVNKEQCFNCLHPYNLTIKSKISDQGFTLRESDQESNATRF